LHPVPELQQVAAVDRQLELVGLAQQQNLNRETTAKRNWQRGICFTAVS